MSTQKPPFKDLRKLTTKDIMNLCDMSASSANRLKKKIKLEFKIPIVLYRDFKKYFCED